MCTNENQFLGPLTLHQKNDKPMIFKSDETVDCLCVLCDKKFILPATEKTLITHIFMEHRLVIADANQIADLGYYLRYWRNRFKDQNLQFFCRTMLQDNKQDGTKSKNKEYFLLSDFLPEDKELRSSLQKLRLDKLMTQHEFERQSTSYVRECLFCRFVSSCTRAAYLNHLYEKHNFFISEMKNLIFIDELVDLLSAKLDKFQCSYCERMFKDKNILKEHMREKGHKRINPNNKKYDKYYLVNYIGDNPSHSCKLKYNKTEDNDPVITCLICNHTETEFERLLDHMDMKHDFSFAEVTRGLEFYYKIKIVNYVRRQIHIKQCFSCDICFDDVKNLVKHLRDDKHLVLKRENWDISEYYFPTYENDSFLCFIEDENEIWWPIDEREIESMSDSLSREMAMAVLND